MGAGIEGAKIVELFDGATRAIEAEVARINGFTSSARAGTTVDLQETV